MNVFHSVAFFHWKFQCDYTFSFATLACSPCLISLFFCSTLNSLSALCSLLIPIGNPFLLCISLLVCSFHPLIWMLLLFKMCARVFLYIQVALFSLSSRATTTATTKTFILLQCLHISHFIWFWNPNLCVFCVQMWIHDKHNSVELNWIEWNWMREKSRPVKILQNCKINCQKSTWCHEYVFMYTRRYISFGFAFLFVSSRTTYTIYVQANICWDGIFWIC